MTDTTENQGRKRSVGRRREDFAVRSALFRLKKLYAVGQIITSEMNMDRLFELIMSETNQIIDSERSSVFLYDEKRGDLFTLIATGMTQDKLRIPSTSGIAGHVFTTRAPMTIDDVTKDSRFFAAVDRKSNFRTRSILAVPLVNREGACVGVLEALNKRDAKFDENDVELLSSIGNYIAIALENAKLYQDVTETSEQLKKALHHIEVLEKAKRQLTKFVPSAVRMMVEIDPGNIDLKKTPVDATVLFMDIEGFSKITESYEQSLVNNMVETYFSAYLNCISKYGGEVNETSGDGLMVIFKDGGRTEHPAAAIKAALEIVAATDVLNRERRYPWGDLRLHLGINTGTAWIGCTKMRGIAGERYTYTASGLTTVVAARIGQLTTRSRLLIGSETYRRIADCSQVAPIGKRTLKNVKKPVAVYRVKSLSCFVPKWPGKEDAEAASAAGTVREKAQGAL
jgi:class 3 adenylate cyclase/putative methionine-R-sulfoxide reductase with GAF domain